MDLLHLSFMKSHCLEFLPVSLVVSHSPFLVCLHLGPLLCLYSVLVYLKIYIYIFFFGCTVSLLLYMQAFFSCEQGPLSSCSQSSGFSLQWLLLWRTGSRHTGFSNCITQTQLLRSMWKLPRPGTEPMPPDLEGWFSTTGPPGKASPLTFSSICWQF